jgi:hypothetical protein
MNTMLAVLIASAVPAAVGSAPAVTPDRARVTIDCKPTSEKFAYDCIFNLTNARTAAPLDKAELTIGAEMPSMPMAHHVRPVAAKATATPGEYQARLTLEMHGDWALRLKVVGPLTDQVVEVRNFNKAGSGPSSKKARSGSGHKR